MTTEEDRKKLYRRCPYCAEEILAAAKKCKHCGSMLYEEDLEPTEGYSIAPAQVELGQTLNERFVVSRRIARGGMAEIFLARDLELDMDVVLKVVPPALADNPKLIKHLREEAKIAIQLTHQNIVRVYSFDASGEVKFIVMEYITGKNLYQLVNEEPEGRFSPQQVLQWLEPACDALEYANSLGVIHRDIKPSNIMVSKEDIVKVADFGIARRLEDSVKSISQQTVRGTPSYMSPEQLRGKGVTVHSDIYSLGATVYKLLSGKPPFVTAVLAASSDRPAPDPIVGIPPRLFRVLKKCLEPDPKKRFGGARELSQAAKDALEARISTRLVSIGHQEPPAAAPFESALRQDAEEMALRVDAEEIADDIDNVGVALGEKAAKAAEDGEFEKATKLYGQLADMMPGNVNVLCRLGDCRARAGDGRGAVEAYQKVIDIEYSNAYAWFQTGLAHEQLNEPEKAIKAYKKAIKSKEADPDLYEEVAVSKVRGQIQNIEWSLKQTEEDRRKELLQMRKRHERGLQAAEEKRRKMIQVVIMIVLVIMLIVVALGAAEYFFHIFELIPF